MNRAELELVLDSLETERSRARIFMHLEVVSQCTAALWIDAPLAERIGSLFRRYGRSIPVFAAPQLEIGETWLLLAESHRGHATRLRARSRTAEPSELERVALDAVDGLVHVTAHHLRSLPDELLGFDVAGLGLAANISGRSLGLSACIAALSRAVGKPPHSDVAGSAVVNAEGELGSVQGLEQKASALRRDWPGVSTLVVSHDQPVSKEVSIAFRIVRASHLDSAVEVFGLAIQDLPAAPVEEYEAKARTFERENQKPNSTEQWLLLSNEARQVGLVLESAQRASDSQIAFLWAAQFATHAGEPRLATDLLGHVPEEVASEYPALHAQRCIYVASNAIETRPALAVDLADAAISACEALSSGDKKRFLGQAIGTKGRALLHTGQPKEAEVELRAAMEHHGRTRPEESPRSASYLAICLRKLGRLDEALRVIQDAWVSLEVMSYSRTREMTKLYVLLERGRIHAEAGRNEEAVGDLRTVRRAQPEPEAYPALGAERSLVQPLARLGRVADARAHLEACMRIATTGLTTNVARIAAIAVGEQLLTEAALLPRETLEPVWRAVFVDEEPRDIVSSWIY